MKNFSIDDVAPEFHKAWHYANDFMIYAIKTEGHCELFLKNSSKWNEEEKEFLLWAWILITTGVDTVNYGSLDDQDVSEIFNELEDYMAEMPSVFEEPEKTNHKNKKNKA